MPLAQLALDIGYYIHIYIFVPHLGILAVPDEMI